MSRIESALSGLYVPGAGAIDFILFSGRNPNDFSGLRSRYLSDFSTSYVPGAGARDLIFSSSFSPKE